MNVYIAPRLGVLRDHLIARLQAAPLPPRDTEIIVVQSQGMRQWLTLATGRDGWFTDAPSSALLHELDRAFGGTP